MSIQTNIKIKLFRQQKNTFIWLMLMVGIISGILTIDIWLKTQEMNWNVLRIWILVHVGLYDGPSMIEIPAGSFLMGDSNCVEGENFISKGKACPQHQVTVKTFWMGKYEVTFDEYSAFVLDSKGIDLPGHSDFGRGKRPVINVSWEDAKRYTEWLTIITGKPYRLATEAEWEYACRAGGETVFYFGDDPEKMNKFAWFSENSGAMTHSVGEKLPNGWGLYDMHGNVWEWVEDDWYHSYYGTPDDGKAFEVSIENYPFRMMRGGGYYSTAQQCRSARRGEMEWKSQRYDFLGFRLVRSNYPDEPFRAGSLSY